MDSCNFVDRRAIPPLRQGGRVNRTPPASEAPASRIFCRAKLVGGQPQPSRRLRALALARRDFASLALDADCRSWLVVNGENTTVAALGIGALALCTSDAVLAEEALERCVVAEAPRSVITENRLLVLAGGERGGRCCKLGTMLATPTRQSHRSSFRRDTCPHNLHPTGKSCSCSASICCRGTSTGTLGSCRRKSMPFPVGDG